MLLIKTKGESSLIIVQQGALSIVVGPRQESFTARLERSLSHFLKLRQVLPPFVLLHNNSSHNAKQQIKILFFHNKILRETNV